VKPVQAGKGILWIPEHGTCKGADAQKTNWLTRGSGEIEGGKEEKNQREQKASADGIIPPLKTSIKTNKKETCGKVAKPGGSLWRVGRLGEF